MRRLIALFLFSFSVAVAGDVGRYIVELDGAPAADLAIREQKTVSRRLSVLKQYRVTVQQQQRILRHVLKRYGINVVNSLDTLANAVVVRMPPEMARVLRRLSGVKRIYPSLPVQPAMDSALVLHHVPEAWAWMGFERAGEGIKIAILDSGIDTTHAAFQMPDLPMPEDYPLGNNAEDLALTTNKVIVYRNYESLYDLEKPAGSRDCRGHGTSVAACAAAVPVTAPLARISGVAPRAYLGAYKVFPGCSGQAAMDDVIVKAMEDAIRDGMNVLNLSLGGAPTRRPEADIMQAAVHRASALGVVVVESAGNDGSDPGTVGDAGKSGESTIMVGASQNGRVFVETAIVSGVAYEALAGDGPKPDPPVIAGQLQDVSLLDGDGLACHELPAGSLAGNVAFILRGTCYFREKLNNAQAAGAVAALVYTDHREKVVMSVLDATLPAMMISHEDGLAIKNQFPTSPGATVANSRAAKILTSAGRRSVGTSTLPVTLDFRGTPRPIADNEIVDFSSRGPAPNDAIKPDLVAVGANVYTAHSKYAGTNGEEYTIGTGTSFSSPIVAGAAAALMAARPNLTPQLYRSLLVNTAQILADDEGLPLPVMDQGAGRLDLEAAMRGTLAANPVSVSFGTSQGTVDQVRQILVTNVGIYPETCSVSVTPFDPGAAPTVSHTSFTLPAGQSQYVGVRFSGTSLPPGVYQGYIHIQGTRPEADIHLPYWHAVGSGIAKYVTVRSAPSAGTPGEVLSDLIYVRVSDQYGVAITDPLPEITVQEGGGEVVHLSASLAFPNTVWFKVKLGPEAGENVFKITAGAASATVVIRGENP